MKAQIERKMILRKLEELSGNRSLDVKNGDENVNIPINASLQHVYISKGNPSQSNDVCNTSHMTNVDETGDDSNEMVNTVTSNEEKVCVNFPEITDIYTTTSDNKGKVDGTDETLLLPVTFSDILRRASMVNGKNITIDDVIIGK